MKIILIRHGQAYNDKLTSLGKKQIKLLKKQLKGYNFQKIYSSPTGRCLQSARILAGKKEVIVCEGLDERFQLAHRPTNAEEQEWWDNYMTPQFFSSVGECYSDFLKRSYRVFDEIIKSESGHDAVVLAHSATSYALYSYLAGSDKVLWTRLGYGNMICFEV